MNKTKQIRIKLSTLRQLKKQYPKDRAESYADYIERVFVRTPVPLFELQQHY